MNIAILLSGGIGSRLHSDIPKQYIHANGKMIVAMTLDGLLDHDLVDMIWIVADEKWQDEIRKASAGDNKVKGFSIPGANRQLSIYNALCDIRKFVSDDDVVLIQDAVRPLTSRQTITDCLTVVEGHDGALPVLAMKDTIYMSKDCRTISGLLDRSSLFAGQAPEAYRYGKYKSANEALLPDKILDIYGAAEPAIMYGMDVAMFPGDEGNFKITTDEDLIRYKKTVEDKSK